MDGAELRQAARPEALLAALEANADELVDPVGHHSGGTTTVRELDHHGHHIVIRTTYEIEVDGRPFEAGVGVSMDGRVHYHGLPTRNFPSMVDLVRKVIDQFPDDFPPGDPGASGETGPGGYGHGDPVPADQAGPPDHSGAGADEPHGPGGGA